MVSEDKKFTVKLNLNITDSDGNPFADSDLTWHNMGYDGVVLLEAILIESLGTLNGVGEARVEASGKGVLMDHKNKKRRRKDKDDDD
jgi:hypothetical protein